MQSITNSVNILLIITTLSDFEQQKKYPPHQSNLIHSSFSHQGMRMCCTDELAQVTTPMMMMTVRPVTRHLSIQRQVHPVCHTVKSRGNGWRNQIDPVRLMSMIRFPHRSRRARICTMGGRSLSPYQVFC